MVTINVGPTYYGEQNLLHCLKEKELGFELELKDEKYVQKFILSLDDVKSLKNQIESSLTAYTKFVNNDD